MSVALRLLKYFVGFACLGLLLASTDASAYSMRQPRPNHAAIVTQSPFPHGLSPTFDPTHPATLYAGSGGIESLLFVSHDSGVNWTTVFMSELDTGSPSALAIDPTQPTNLYVGHRDYTLCCASFGNGVFKSTDSGATWTAANQGLQDQGITALAVNPITSTVLYAGVYTGYIPAQGRGVYKSTDAGTSWRASSTGLPQDVFVETLTGDPHDANLIYAITNQGVYISRNSGDSWSVVSQSLSGTTAHALRVDPQQGLRMYAATDQGVFISNDGGATWTLRPASTALGVIYDLAFEPTDVSRLYAATAKGVFISQDAGVTWSPVQWVAYIPLLRK